MQNTQEFFQIKDKQTKDMDRQFTDQGIQHVNRVDAQTHQ